MKKFTMVLALVLMITMPMMAEHVSPETAQKVAKAFLSNNGAKANLLTDLTKAAGFENLYIFNADEGFVVMAADDCVQPILGYSLTGKFVAEGMPENIRWWLQGYNGQIQNAIDEQTKATPEVTKQWNDLTDGSASIAKSRTAVGPLIQTHWKQGNPYNNLCPSGSVTGCVATAMAQVMRFWEYPSRGIGSHDYQHSSYGILNADFGATLYDWGNMTNTYTSSSTAAQKVAVATLMYHCGVSVEMKYSPSESGSNIKRSSTSMRAYFNYNTNYLERKNFDETDWTNTLKTELDQNHPMLYGGSGSSGGHAFVCDGYDSNDNFHFNWGWGGSSDGYFAISDLNPGSHSFNNSQNAVIGIYPLTDNTLPLELSLNQTGEGITLNWTDSQNSTSYSIYRNNALIATISESTFTDANPHFGSNIYYVRGLKNDVLSLPSNYESAIVDYLTPTANNLEANPSADNITLSWDAADWCYPAQPDEASFSYVNEERLELDAYYDWSIGDFVLSWGHRYPAENLATFDGKAIYEISFFTLIPGSFDVIVYEDTNSNHPVQEIARQSITTARVGWSRVSFNSPIVIDSSKDLWIFVSNTDYNVHTIYIKTISGHTNACYYAGENPTESCQTLNSNNAWLIHAYLTDGTYTYSLYDGATVIESELAATNYTVTNPANNTVHQYTVRTNYYDGESNASNMVGFTLGTATIPSLELDATDKMTIANGSSLTVTGTLTNNTASNLILENGAQLVHNSNNVAATVKKSIESNTTANNGWNFISSPVTENITPNTENGLLGNTYDLYYYDEPTHYWKNYKTSNFILTHKQGYLYANNTTTTLQFEGTLNPSVSPIAITNLSHSAESLNGFNLIGNPFACNATIDQDCYVISGNKVVLASDTKVFAPCEGAFVKATSDDFTVNFSKSVGDKTTDNGNHLDIVVKQEEKKGSSTTQIIDRARVRFGKGVGMEKYALKDNDTQLTLWQDGEEFAVVYSDGQTETPINFKATQNGTYTLSIESQSIELDYLHLIDNLTGYDIDLLTTPSYTFEAKVNDYVSRFKLVYSNSEDTDCDNATFAFISNGDIIVNHEGHATLQILDLAGRIVMSGDEMNRISTKGMAPGVYVIRLVTADEVRTQKIIVE